MRNYSGSVSVALMGLMQEFRRARGKFEAPKAATFLALMNECMEECERLEIAAHPMPIRICANDNNRDAA